jgi:hypothetical protein
MENMQQKDMESAVLQLIYYLKNEQKNGNIIVESLARVKEKILKRNNAKHIEIYRLFRRFTDEQIIEAFQDSYNSQRYYRYKIITKLLMTKEAKAE